MEIEVIEGRSVIIKKHHNGYAYYTFNEICKFHFSPTDFMGICKNIEGIFIQDIPEIHMDDRDSASRFITLIDEMYNHNVKLYCSS